jgi:hypothetical protein
MDSAPVLYLDLDDTVVAWAGGRPHAAPGAREFVLWALKHFEVRWLTTWCPSGEMEESLLCDLCKMLNLPPDWLRHIRGFNWEAGDSKLNGIAWLEHLVVGRPFVWLEDNYGVRERERSVLSQYGLLDSYHCCNVTEDPNALVRVHETLRQRAGTADEEAA